MTSKAKDLSYIGSSSPASLWLFLVTFSLVFYGMGAAFVESFVNYPTWRYVGAAEFQAFHRALSPLIIGNLVIPIAAALILTAMLVWKRPAPIPRWAIWCALILQIIGAVSTIVIQIPIQMQLSTDGLSLELIDRLIITNFWLRRIPMLINNILFFWMMSLLLKANRGSRSTQI